MPYAATPVSPVPSLQLLLSTQFGETGDEDLPLPKCPIPSHDPLEVTVAVFLLLGMIVSYLPQHYRIISTKSSEGFSQLFLLLGAIATNCGTLNIVLLQWGLFGCCRNVFTAGECAESLLGVAQIGMQWIMFMGIVVLYMAYFPEHKKHVQDTVVVSPRSPVLERRKTPLSEEWKTSLRVVAVLVAYLVFSVLMSAFCLTYYGVGSDGVLWFGGINGLMSMGLATVQFLPQIYWTWKAKIVGALSIPMMMMQTPGSFLLAYTISIRPGTNWTSWITYVVAGTFQGMLLFMCIAWHLRDPLPVRLPEEGEQVERNMLPSARQDPARDLAAILTASFAATWDGPVDERRPLLNGRTSAAVPTSSTVSGDLATQAATGRQTVKRARSPSPVSIEDGYDR